MTKLVFDIKPSSPTQITALDRHCRIRELDGFSDIDPDRSHLNKIIIGSKDGVAASLKEFYDGDVARPAKQSETPYLRIVVSASPAYFRPKDPDAAGTWDENRLEIWLDATIKQLENEHGHDLVHLELHLDEVTPHLHAVVAPTYQKKKRRPGRKKRNETDVEFEDRKRKVENAPTQRTVGRSSHETLSEINSFGKLRERMSEAVSHLGIEYGTSLTIDDPAPQSTRQWVKKEAAKLRELSKNQEIEATRLNDQAAQLDRQAQQLANERSKFEQAKDLVNKLSDRIIGAAAIFASKLHIKLPHNLQDAILEIEAAVVAIEIAEIKVENPLDDAAHSPDPDADNTDFSM